MKFSEQQLEKAYGGENYSILRSYINKDGWFNEDLIHDPVSTIGMESKTFKKAKGYESTLWYRPLSLNDTPTILKEVDESPLNTEIEKLATETGMQLTEAQNIGAAFAPYMEKVNELTEAINSIPVDNPSVKDAALARKLRLELVSNRGKNGLDSVHKDLKAAVLVRQRAIDGLKNYVENSSKIAELRAEGIEKHSERVENARLDVLESERLSRLEPFGPIKYGVNIRMMDDDIFEQYFNNEKLLFEAQERERLEAERREQAALNLVKDRTKLLVDAGAKFDGEVFTAGTISVRLDAIADIADKIFDLTLNNIKGEVLKINQEQAKKDTELAAFKKAESEKQALLLSRFNSRSAELVKAGFQFKPEGKMFTHTESAHDNIPSSAIVNMEDKPWKEYLKSVVDAVNLYREQVKLKDEFKNSAIQSLIENGFVNAGSGYASEELDWFIPSKDYSDFTNNDDFNTWYSQVKLQHAKLTQAKADADKIKADKEIELERANKAAALLKEPDLNQARAFYSTFNALKFPSLKSDAGKVMETKVNAALEELRKLIISEAKKLV